LLVRFNIFVASRVASIQELTESVKWRYVPTSLSTADILSRGAFPTKLNKSPFWAHGPAFLCASKADWSPPIIAEKLTHELRRRTLLIKPPYEDIVASSKYANSFTAFQRVLGYIYKFGNRIRHPMLTVPDLQNGTKLLLFVLSCALIYAST